MTGPEHYRLAERILAETTAQADRIGQSLVDAAEPDRLPFGLLLGVQTAQVHATLALAAGEPRLGRGAPK